MNKLDINFEVGNIKTYRFETIVSEEIMPNYILEKKYVRNVEISFLRKHKELYQYQILSIKFDFSDQDTASGFLLKKISYLFDEIDLYIDEENNIVKLNNLNSIKLRWKQLQMKLLETNKGSVVENYFRQISDVLEDEKKFIELLSGYNMFGLYFNGQSGKYPDNGRKIRKITEEKNEYLYRETFSAEEIRIKMKSSEYKNESQTEGISIYEKGLLKENFVSSKENNHQIKYSLLWVG